MAKQSAYATIAEPLSGQFFSMILTPDGGPSGTGKAEATTVFGSQLFKDAMLAYAKTIMVAGSGMVIDSTTDPTILSFISSGGGSSYTAENARDDVAAAARGDSGYLTVTADDPGDTITWAIDAALKTRIATLEAARSLVQVKDNLTATGAAYVSFPGGSGNYVSAPHAAGHIPAGDFTVVVRVKMPASAPGAAVILASKYDVFGTGMFRFGINTNGSLFFVASNGTTTGTGTSTSFMPFDGNWYWVRASRTSSSGQVDFTYAADQAWAPVTVWTNLTLNRGTYAGALNAGTTALFNAGAYNGGTTNVFTGQISRIMTWSSISAAGTPTIDMDAANYTSGTTFTDTHSNTFTLQGTATVVQGGVTGTYNTASEFILAETDVNAAIPVAFHDTLLWSAEGTFVNTHASIDATFTPKLRIAGVDLFTFSAITIPHVASGQIYNWSVGVRIEVNANDGSTQIARAQLIINNNVTGTDAGSIVMASNLANVSGNRTGAIATITSIPNIQLKLTMNTAAATIGARNLLTQLFIAKG